MFFLKQTFNKSKSHLTYIISILLFSNILFSQNYSLKGQVWYSTLTGNDIPENDSHFESKLGTIATFSVFNKLNDDQLIDFEYAHIIDHVYSGRSMINLDTIKISVFKKSIEYNTRHGIPYRFWIRYSNEKLEARLGLQKITFGPTQILRNLSWFDYIDVTDPTGQISGVRAFRLKWFPVNTISIWSWSILNELNNLSFGFRSEISHFSGEWAISYHNDEINRWGLDYRYDGYFGFWNESSAISSSNLKQIIATLGLDYTLPISNGIYLMTEFMSIQQQRPIKSNQNYNAILATIPFGMIHKLSIIKQISLNEKKNYNFLRWSSEYDNFSLNYIFSINPKRNEYLPVVVPSGLEGFGSTIKIMLIYNY